MDMISFFLDGPVSYGLSRMTESVWPSSEILASILLRTMYVYAVLAVGPFELEAVARIG